MKKFNVGILGYGNVAKAHVAAINKTTLGRVTAVCSSREQSPSDLPEGAKLYRTLESLLTSDVDVVDVCGYPQLHVEQALAVVRAGKHIILEKPISLTREGSLSLDRAISSAGVRVCVCYELRFSNQIQVTKSLIDSGMIGTIHYGEIDYFHGIGPWSGQFHWNRLASAGGSSLLSAGCHALNALLLCMGGKVDTVTSFATRSRSDLFKDYEYPTTSVTILQFSDGRIGKVASVIDSVQPYYFHTHLVGSEGSILDDKFHSQKVAGLSRHNWSRLGMKLADSGDVHDHPYRHQFEAFFQATAKGEDMPLTNWKESLETDAVIHAADLSARRGTTVKLNAT